MKSIVNRVISLMVTITCYVGFVGGVEGPRNVATLLVWIGAAASVIILLAIASSGDAAGELFPDYRPRGRIARLWDAAEAGLRVTFLAWGGGLITAVIAMISYFLAIIVDGAVAKAFALRGAQSGPKGKE